LDTDWFKFKCISKFEGVYHLTLPIDNNDTVKCTFFTDEFDRVVVENVCLKKKHTRTFVDELIKTNNKESTPFLCALYNRENFTFTQQYFEQLTKMKLGLMDIIIFIMDQKFRQWWATSKQSYSNADYFHF
jgi:hypothetical protein